MLSKNVQEMIPKIQQYLASQPKEGWSIYYMLAMLCCNQKRNMSLKS